jgi:hypothetical protein
LLKRFQSHPYSPKFELNRPTLSSNPTVHSRATSNLLNSTNLTEQSALQSHGVLRILPSVLSANLCSSTVRSLWDTTWWRKPTRPLTCS